MEDNIPGLGFQNDSVWSLNTHFCKSFHRIPEENKKKWLFPLWHLFTSEQVLGLLGAFALKKESPQHGASKSL